MGLVDSLIISSCVGFTGNAQEACNKALLAGARQSGIESKMNDSESKYTRIAEAQARYYLGNQPFDYMGAAVFIARSAASQSVSFGLPTYGFCNSINMNLGAQNSLLKFEWNF